MYNIKKISGAVALSLLAFPVFAQTASMPQKQGQVAASSSAKEQMEQAQKFARQYKLSKRDFMANAERSFDERDKNHDGVLSADELGINGAGSSVPANNAAPTYYNAKAPNAEIDDDAEVATAAKPVIAEPKGAGQTAGGGKANAVPPASSIPPVNR